MTSSPTPNEIKTVYKTLLKEYGAQGWWPTTPKGKLSPEYLGGPKSSTEKLEVMVGAILTQNTAWTNVERALSKIHALKLCSVEALLKIKEARLHAPLKSTGYFRAKAKKIKKLVEFLSIMPVKKLETLGLAESRKALLEVYGIGPETADSILLYALAKPSFVIDACTIRIFSRIGLTNKKDNYLAHQAIFQATLPRTVALYNEFHALIVTHGKHVCRPKPKCDDCCLVKLCKRIDVTKK